MRFLVISDIHANRFGLQAVLDAASGCYDQLLCLGDIVGYGAHPNECCHILQEHDAYSLSGNHDAAAVGLIETRDYSAIANVALRWTRRVLIAENSEWLKTLQPQRDFSEFSFQAVHGGLSDPWEEYLTGTHSAKPTLSQMTHRLCFFGHTHIAIGYSNLDQPGRKYKLLENPYPNGGTITCHPDWKYLINPGSCGQPRDRNPQARYVLFDTEKRHVEVKCVDYDVEAAREAIYEAGLPTILGDRLLQGR